MHHRFERAQPSCDLISAEFHFLMEEYFAKLGCAPPIGHLVSVPGMMAVALLSEAILLKKPIADFDPSFRE